MKIKGKLGVIGVGNMGSAILDGLFAKKLMRPAQVLVFDRDLAKARAFARKKKTGLAVSNEDLVRRSNLVLLAIKPQDLAATAGEFRSAIRPSHVLISILAGTPIKKIQKVLGTKAVVVRAMPNLGAKVGAGMTAVTGTRSAQTALAEKIFSGCGKTVQLAEKYFDLVTAISGSGPAYYFLLTELLVNAAVKQGLSAEKARLLAVQTALGAGLLAAQSEEGPDVLRERVTSKGGTTAAALQVFEHHHMEQMVARAVQAAQNRGRELSRA